ncbi:putative bifunctional diguanylate cyclase/phosphodiesterase [Methylobacterium sp. JK268]
MRDTFPPAAANKDRQGSVATLAARWWAARPNGATLPPYEEIALGNLGRFADRTAILRREEEVAIVRSAPGFDAWFHDEAEDGGRAERSDCRRVVDNAVARALDRGEPDLQTASRVERGIVEVFDILALPLRTSWGFPVVLVYVGDSLGRSSLVEKVYQSTREGMLALAPVRDAANRVLDLQIVSLNAGAGRLIGAGTAALLWRALSSLRLGRHAERIMAGLLAVLENGQEADFELDYSDTPAAAAAHLKVSATAAGDLVIVTLVDISEVKSREASFRMMFQANPVPMWVLDAQTLRFLDVNEAAVAHYGYARQTFLAMTALDLRPEEEREALRAAIGRPGAVYNGERAWAHLRADGSRILVLPYSRPLTVAERPAVLIAAIDITARHEAEAEARRIGAFLDTIVENIPAMLFVKDAADDRFVLMNRAGEDLLGIARADLIGRRADEAGVPALAEDPARPAPPMAAVTVGAVTVEERVIETRRNGARTVHLRTLGVPAEDGGRGFLIGIAEDITERRAIEARIAHMAHHDALTDLPNRLLFCERLDAALAGPRRAGAAAAVLCLDLDQFKHVNDTLGHPAGDELLRQVAARLREALREGDTVARFGGDEFAVLLAAPVQPEEAGATASRIIRALADPFTVHGQDLAIGTSMGVVLAPGDGDTTDILLRNADLALYRAKAEGRGTFRFFEPEMNARLQARRSLERDLRQTFQDGGLDLHYQPLFSASADRLSGCEALLRWLHPERGFVSPAEFVPLAEESGLIVPIGDWVLRRACAEAATWPDPIKVAVNLSPVQFRGRQLVSSVVSALAASGLRPDRLELEITESILLADSEANLSVLHQLRDLGVRIALDDFGTGYASLSYLRTFPFDKIKIDQSFVRELRDNRHCQAIVQAVTGLGSSLGIATVAEGVETADQLACLRDRGCDEVQGYLFSRPLPSGELRALLHQRAGRRTQAA